MNLALQNPVAFKSLCAILERSPDQNPNVIILHEDGKMIYGFKLMKNIINSGQSQEVVKVSGIELED